MIKYKLLIFVFFLNLIAIVTIAQEKRALLIGIGNYPQETGWSRIHGNNDVGLIWATLKEHGFKNDNIIEMRDSVATYLNIVKAFENLLSISDKNDIVYIQFSGHGQRITDVSGDEKDGFDEAWIPYDAMNVYKKGVYEGEKHITDDYLYDYLTDLRSKIGCFGKIIVVADACHSGSGSRGDDEQVFIRGSSEAFIIPVFPAQVSCYEKLVGDWLFVAACKDYQTNYEHKANDGNYYGMLSYSISESKNFLKNIRYNQAVDFWKTTMKKIRRYPQDIEVEGMPCRYNVNLF